MPSGKKLTPSMISRIPLLDQGQEWHWDSQVVGFALQVGKTARSYICQCRGKRSTLGRADVLTLDEARRADVLPITRCVLDEAEARLNGSRDASGPVPFFIPRRGKAVILRL